MNIANKYLLNIKLKMVENEVVLGNVSLFLVQKAPEYFFKNMHSQNY